MLASGGSAVDAANAANTVLAATEPNMDGIGGDLFVLYREGAGGRLVGLNGCGPAPRALSRERLSKLGINTMPIRGINSVTVPGAVDGWATMHARYDKLAWKQLFEPAIVYAEQGFAVHEVIQEAWSDAVQVQKLRADPESVRRVSARR